MEDSATNDLMAASIRDEIEDFDRVVAAYRPSVFRFALASLRDVDAAETLTQDCFFKAYRSRDQFRGDASVKTWLMQITVNLVRDRVRNRRFQFWRRTQMAAVDAFELREAVANRDASPESQALVKDQVREIWKAAQTLPERQRSVFLLRFVEEMELLEIAQALGISEGSVKSHLFRALQRIRERMGEIQ